MRYFRVVIEARLGTGPAKNKTTAYVSHPTVQLLFNVVNFLKKHKGDWTLVSALLTPRQFFLMEPLFPEFESEGRVKVMLVEYAEEVGPQVLFDYREER
jgi:hypothetical protein